VASFTSTSTPRHVVMESDQLSQGHSVSSLSAPPSNSPSAGTISAPPTEDQDVLRRQLEAACDAKPLLDESKHHGASERPGKTLRTKSTRTNATSGAA